MARALLVSLLDSEITVAELLTDGRFFGKTEGEPSFCCADEKWPNSTIVAEAERFARKHGLSAGSVAANVCQIAAERHGMVRSPPFGDWSPTSALPDSHMLCACRIASFVYFFSKQSGFGKKEEILEKLLETEQSRFHFAFICVLDENGTYRLADYFAWVGEDEVFWDEVYEFITNMMSAAAGENASREASFGGRVMAAVVEVAGKSSIVERGLALSTLLRVVQKILTWSVQSENTAEPRLANPFRFAVGERPWTESLPTDDVGPVWNAVLLDILTGGSGGYKPLKIRRAISTQRSYGFGSLPATYKEVMFLILGCVGCEAAVGKLKEAIWSCDVNWGALFACVVCVLGRFTYSAKALMENAIAEILAQGCGTGSDEYKIAALLLARQMATDFGPNCSAYLNYERWWRETFCKKDGYVLRNKHLEGFKTLLVKLVPCEPAVYLKVQVNNQPSVVGALRESWIEYELLAKTRIMDLADSSSAPSEPKKAKLDVADAVAQDVDSAAEDYVRKGEIPFSLLHMKVLRSHYYHQKFIPELLKPRVLPSQPDGRMKLIEALAGGHHIKADAHAKYMQECELASAGYLDITDSGAEKLMEEMNAQVEVDSLLRALTEFELAFRSEAEVEKRREERVSQKLVDVGKQLTNCLGRFSTPSSSSYVEVDVSEDLISSAPKMAEVCSAVLDTVGRCVEYMRSKKRLDGAFRKQAQLKGLINLIANDKSLSASIHLMTMYCVTREDWDELLDQISSSCKATWPTALGLIEGWMRATTDSLPSVKIIVKGSKGKTNRIVDSFLDGLHVCLEPPAKLKLNSFLRVLEGTLIPQVNERNESASGDIVHAVPKDLLPLVFLALDRCKDSLDPGVVGVLWEKLRENSSSVPLDEWLKLELGGVEVFGNGARTSKSDSILSNLVLLSPDGDTRRGIETALSVICRRALENGGTERGEVLRAVNEAYQLGLVASQKPSEESPVFLELWRRTADDCGSTSSGRVDRLMVDLWAALPAWVLTCDAVNLGGRSGRQHVNVQCLTYLIERNWCETFVEKPDYLLPSSLLLRFLQALPFARDDILELVTLECRFLSVSILYHWEHLEPVLRKCSSRSSPIASLTKSVAAARCGEVPQDLGPPMDLAVGHWVRTAERAGPSPSADKFSIPWLNGLPEDFLSELAMACVVRLALVAESEPAGSVVGWLVSGDDDDDKHDGDGGNRLGPKVSALCAVVGAILNANRASNSWSGLKHFLPRCPPDEFLANPSSELVGCGSSAVFPVTARVEFFLPFYKMGVLARSWCAWGGNRRPQGAGPGPAPHAAFVRAWIVTLWHVNSQVESFFENKADAEVRGFLPASWLRSVERLTEGFLEATDRVTWSKLRGFCSLLDSGLARVARRKGAS